jgi:hypothetical protein
VDSSISGATVTAFFSPAAIVFDGSKHVSDKYGETGEKMRKCVPSVKCDGFLLDCDIPGMRFSVPGREDSALDAS